jgi:hypothetical protein
MNLKDLIHKEKKLNVNLKQSIRSFETIKRNDSL